jgi:hypothetical protein
VGHGTNVEDAACKRHSCGKRILRDSPGMQLNISCEQKVEDESGKKVAKSAMSE